METAALFRLGEWSSLCCTTLRAAGEGRAGGYRSALHCFTAMGGRGNTVYCSASAPPDLDDGEESVE
jgi:hypothetical protein